MADDDKRELPPFEKGGIYRASKGVRRPRKQSLFAALLAKLGLRR